jgi:hypothetical protein
VHLIVPLERLAILPRAEGSSAQVEVLLRAREAKTGAIVEGTQIVDVVPSDGDQEEAALTVHLELDGGVYVLGVSLRDVATGAMSVVSTTIALQNPSAG